VSIDSYLRLLLYSVGVVSSAADFIDMMIRFVVLPLLHSRRVYVASSTVW